MKKRKATEGKTASRCVLASATRLTNRYRERTQAGKQSKARSSIKKKKEIGIFREHLEDLKYFCLVTIAYALDEYHTSFPILVESEASFPKGSF
jgi:hypothetical protein